MLNNNYLCNRAPNSVCVILFFMTNISNTAQSETDHVEIRNK